MNICLIHSIKRRMMNCIDLIIISTYKVINKYGKITKWQTYLFVWDSTWHCFQSYSFEFA